MSPLKHALMLFGISVLSFLGGFVGGFGLRMEHEPKSATVIAADTVTAKPDAGYVVVEGRDIDPITIPRPDEWLTPDESMAYACAGEWPARLRHRAGIDSLSPSEEACDEWRGARALRLLSGANIDAGVIVGAVHEASR